MTILFIILAIIFAYLIGSFPSAYIIGRLRKGIDIRQQGSRNMGAMNVFYTVGFSEGVTVLALDIAKGAATVALARLFGVQEIVQLMAGVAAVLGHSFPVFLGFRGGKGGATCIGIFAFLIPWGIPFFLVIFGLIMLLTRFPTLSYGLALLCFPLVAWGFYKWELAVYSAGLLLFVLLRYIPRIKEMRAKGGSWQHVLHRKGFRDRF